jgi:hypothetical protein
VFTFLTTLSFKEGKMATKQEKAVERAVNRANKLGKMREEKHILWVLVAIIVILLWLLLSQHFGWWPYSRPKLGNAFYTNIGAYDAKPSGSTANTSTESNVSTGSNTNTGTTTPSGGNTGGSGGGGGGTTTPSGSSGLLNFAAGVNVGETKGQISGQANGLGESCAVVVNGDIPNAGKQEVCTYSQGDKIITVTYLNDRVISASKSGF